MPSTASKQTVRETGAFARRFLTLDPNKTTSSPVSEEVEEEEEDVVEEEEEEESVALLFIAPVE